jgi:hypothetical protein
VQVQKDPKVQRDLQELLDQPDLKDLKDLQDLQDLRENPAQLQKWRN